MLLVIWLTVIFRFDLSDRPTLGVAALNVWMLNLVGGLVFNFRYWIAGSFFLGLHSHSLALDQCTGRVRGSA
jgi:hypothetical protein